MKKSTLKNRGISFFHKNLANCISIIGVVPLGLLLLDNGFVYILPLIIFNNIMDDLDGIVAKKLRIGSEFGGNLDNVCDAVAHVLITLAVGAHFGGAVFFISMIAAAALILRVTSRVAPNAPPGIGSPTNELMRHLLLALLFIQHSGVDPGYILIPLMLLHSVSMLAPFRMPALIRARTKTVLAVGLVNLSLVLAYLVPATTNIIAIAFIGTFLYALTLGWFGVWRGENNQN